MDFLGPEPQFFQLLRPKLVCRNSFVIAAYWSWGLAEFIKAAPYVCQAQELESQLLPCTRHKIFKPHYMHEKYEVLMPETDLLLRKGTPHWWLTERYMVRVCQLVGGHELKLEELIPYWHRSQFKFSARFLRKQCSRNPTKSTREQGRFDWSWPLSPESWYDCLLPWYDCKFSYMKRLD